MPVMARLRHKAAARQATEIREATERLRRETQHDPLMQLLSGAALPSLLHLERRAAEIVAAEDTVANCTLTTRSPSELRRLAATSGNEDALAELRRREVLPAAA